MKCHAYLELLSKGYIEGLSSNMATPLDKDAEDFAAKNYRAGFKRGEEDTILDISKTLITHNGFTIDDVIELTGITEAILRKLLNDDEVKEALSTDDDDEDDKQNSTCILGYLFRE